MSVQFLNFTKYPNTGMYNMSPIGYKITNMPVNLAAHWAMGDRSWTSNFGLQTQYNLFPDYASNFECSLAQGLLTNPFHISNWNPMLYGVINAGGNNGVDMMNQQRMMEIAEKNAESFCQNWFGNKAAGMFNAVSQKLESGKATIEEIIAEPDLTDAQKQQLIAQIEKIKDLEVHVQELKAQFEAGADNKAIVEELEAIQGKFVEISKETNELVQKIIKDIKEGKQAEIDETTDIEDADGIDETGEIDDAGNKKTEEAKNKKEAKTKVMKEAVEIAAELFVAIDGISITNKKLEEAMAKINKDNVIEVFSVWKRDYAENFAEDDPGGLIESIYDEYNLNPFSNREDKEVGKIADAFKARALEMGTEVYALIAPKLAVVNSEINSYWTREGRVAKAIDEIHEILAACQAKGY